MRLVKIDDSNGDVIFINPDHVVAVCSIGGITTIVLTTEIKLDGVSSREICTEEDGDKVRSRIFPEPEDLPL